MIINLLKREKLRGQLRVQTIEMEIVKKQNSKEMKDLKEDN